MNFLAQKLWCCGNLQTAAISVGVSDILFLILSAGHFLEIELQQEFGLHIIAFVLVFLFLAFSSILMLHGVVKKQFWLLLPWLILHFAAIFGAILLVILRFKGTFQ